MIKKICSLMLAVLLAFSAIAPAYADGDADGASVLAVKFVDVDPSAYYADAVRWAIKRGITNGTDATHFSPDKPCTRAEIVTLLYRLDNADEYFNRKATVSFEDVPKFLFFTTPVAWAQELHIVNGTTPTTFSPFIPCTRAQIATMLYRYSGMGRQYECALEGKLDEAMTQRTFKYVEGYIKRANTFWDVEKGSYYEAPVGWGVEWKAINGTAPHIFSPNAPCTRAQVVTMLYRLSQVSSSDWDFTRSWMVNLGNS